MDHIAVLRPLTAVAVATVLAGCMHQEPFGLPPLGSPAVQQGPYTTLYYGFGTYPRYGYDPYYYYPYYYGSGYAGHPYPSAAYLSYPRGSYCRDANRDGHCDVRLDPPHRDPAHDAGAVATPRPPAATRLPGRPTLPPKVAQPKPSQSQVVRTEPEPVRRFEPPTQQRSPRIPKDEP